VQINGAIPGPEQVAVVLSAAPWSTPWLYEGPARHWIRAHLCLAGEAPWTRADIIAAVVVERAREIARLPVPIGWDRNIVTGWIECENPDCGRIVVAVKPHQRYCSARCAMSEAAIERRRTHPRIAARHCSREGCGRPIERPSPTTLYCSRRCTKLAWKDRQKALRIDLDRKCADLACGNPIPFGVQANARFCSERCRMRAGKKRRRRQRNSNGLAANGHAG
jgi:predicted nucleic acid-binding Zn ribbon protein